MSFSTSELINFFIIVLLFFTSVNDQTPIGLYCAVLVGYILPLLVGWEPLSTKLIEAQADFEKLKKEYSVAKDQKFLELRAELELLNIETDSMKRK
jgi:hypothetical protein